MVGVSPHHSMRGGIVVNTGLREVVVILLVGVFVAALIALLFPRKWVPLRIKRAILWVWIVLGLVQIVEGASSPAGATMLMRGISEVAMCAGGLLLFTDRRWRRTIGGFSIALGLVLFAAAGAVSSTPR